MNRCLASSHEPASVYAGTGGHGVLRSTDGTQSWRPAGLDGAVVTALAISPVKPGTLYAGSKPARLHVSHDGGEHWRELPALRRRVMRTWAAVAVAPVEVRRPRHRRVHPC